MLAEIITIGDEILIGQIVDTNSAWISKKLNDIGVRVKQITSVSDDKSHILEALNSARQRADIILITGGLGPTKDDITKTTLAQYFQVGFRRDEASLEMIQEIFKRYKAPLLDVNLRQADVLANCKTLLNRNGTAPGMWIEEHGKVYVSMPGVPFEMMYLMEEEVIPRLKELYRLPFIVHHTILTAGIGESFLADKIASVEYSLPSFIKLAYLPKLGLVRLRLTGLHDDEGVLKTAISAAAKSITDIIGEHVIAQEDKPIEKALLDLMASRKLTLSVAESCTGGYISHLFTQHPGSSKVFLGGGVTYSNELKSKLLGVSESTLRDWGAVSEQTVREMAAGAIENFGSDYSIAVSGIAGPDGGTEDKPVGTVWVAVATANRVEAKKFQFGQKRTQNIERSAISALTMLFKILQEQRP